VNMFNAHHLLETIDRKNGRLGVALKMELIFTVGIERLIKMLRCYLSPCVLDEYHLNP